MPENRDYIRKHCSDPQRTALFSLTHKKNPRQLGKFTGDLCLSSEKRGSWGYLSPGYPCASNKAVQICRDT